MAKIKYLSLSNLAIFISKLNIFQNNSQMIAYVLLSRCSLIKTSWVFSLQDLAVLNLPFVLAADRRIGMVVVDDIASGYQLARMEHGGLAFGRFVNNRLTQIIQACTVNLHESTFAI